MMGLTCSWNTSTRAETRTWNMLQKLTMSSWCSSEVTPDFRLWFSSDSQIIREPSGPTTFHSTNSFFSLRRDKLFKLVSINFLFCLCIWPFDILKNFLLVLQPNMFPFETHRNHRNQRYAYLGVAATFMKILAAVRRSCCDRANYPVETFQQNENKINNFLTDVLHQI